MIANWAASTSFDEASYGSNDANDSYMSEQMATFSEIPISVLRSKSRDLLSRRLNTIKVILSENGLPRDFRGVLQCIGLNELLHSVQTKYDPMREVLDLWVNNQPNSATICQLQHILGNIDRWDVVDDTNDLFDEDIKLYLDQLTKTPIRYLINETNPINEENILTTSDIRLAERGLPPAKYDAFILFHNEDIEFATMLVEKLEEYGLRLFLKERDLLAGSLESDATMRMISERCERLVALFSNAFFSKQSNLDDFLLKYAQAISIEQRRRKIVPVCIYGDCVMPSQFSMYFPLRYRPEKLYNFWERLRDSIRHMPEIVPRITITEADDKMIVASTDIKQRQQPQLNAMPAIELHKDDCEQGVELRKLSPSALDRFKHMLLSGYKLNKSSSVSSSRWTISDQMYDKDSVQRTSDHLLVDEGIRSTSSLSLNNTKSSPTKSPNAKTSLTKYLTPGSKKKLLVESDSSIERDKSPNKKEPQKKWYHRRFRSKKCAKTKEAPINS